MRDPTPPTSTDEKVARITSRQAIIVALIGATSGFGGILIQKYFGSDQQYSIQTPLVQDGATQPRSTQGGVTQKWLTIQDIESNILGPINYQLIIKVNGRAYSYPSRRLFMTSDIENTPRESFPLPIGTDHYSISFEAIYVPVGSPLSDGRPNLVSEEVISAKQYPYDGTYFLMKAEDTWTSERIIVRFSVTDNI